MIPGVIAGHYRPEDCRIDLRSLAARAGARFFQDSALGMDPARREVITARGERLAYDFLSLDIGSAIREPAGTGERAIRLRPVEAFLADGSGLRPRRLRRGGRRAAATGPPGDIRRRGCRERDGRGEAQVRRLRGEAGAGPRAQLAPRARGRSARAVPAALPLSCPYQL